MAKILGGILLIVGTSIGGGMLALPMVTAPAGFWWSSAFMILVWLVMTLAAFCLLEVNLYSKKYTNLISMAQSTLGTWGQIITWIVYLLLLYSLLSAYVSAGAALLRSLLASLHLFVSFGLSALLFVVVFGFIVSLGIQAVDKTNRVLMVFKLSTFLLLIALILQKGTSLHLPSGHLVGLPMAVMPIVTAFGFAIIVPSLRAYFHSDVKILRRVLLWGSLVPLVCYLLWNCITQGVIPAASLTKFAYARNGVAHLMSFLGAYAQRPLVIILAHIFVPFSWGIF